MKKEAVLRASLAAMALTGACREPSLGAVGISTPQAGPSSSSSSRTTDAGTRPSPIPADFRDRMVRLVDRALSRGHGERYDAIVWADEAAREGWESGGDFADGATLVEELIDATPPRRPDPDAPRDKSGRPAGLLSMEKRGGAWRFAAVGPDGDVADDTKTASCKTCHDSAPRDDVFRVSNHGS